MFAPPLAHLGHWYVSLPVFMGPVLLVVIALKVQTWRERRYGPDQSGKRSTVTMTHSEDGKATITMTGPLDYPATLNLEVELAKIVHDTREIVLDLRQLKSADEQAVWNFCDTLGRTRTNNHISALIRPEPAMDPLRTICAEEGVELIEEVPTTPHS
jgi:ABC-type transporter Mla MlaB component